MTRIIDKRLNSKNKSAVNRQRFIERYKSQIKKSVSKAILKRNITDIEKGETISIPAKDISEPFIHHGPGGVREIVHPGNKEFMKGDQIKRQTQEESAQGNEASNSGEGEDEFVFDISRDEFLDLYFDDLELPNLVKKQMAKIPSFESVRAGITTCGVPTNINIIRSMRQSLARRISLKAPHQKELKRVENELEIENKSPVPDEAKINQLTDEIKALKEKIKNVPYIDDFDIRYNNRVVQSKPASKAVMFCIMDVSGSMDEEKKDIAKRFFILLYLFLTRKYEKIDLVFIRHHTSAKQVSEEEFFYSRETGGTVVSSALDLAKDLIAKEYPSNNWNIYMAQASDGDNWNADSPFCQEILNQHIMPFVQHYAYIEIMPRHHQSLWEAYTQVAEMNPDFVMQNIDKVSDIYPVFRELFKRQNV